MISRTAPARANLSRNGWKRVARTAARLIGCALPVAVLLQPALPTGSVGGFPPRPLTTSTGLMLLGLGLAIDHPGASRWRRLAIRTCGLLASLVGATGLAEITLRDWLPVHHHLGGGTSLATTLGGAALVLLRSTSAGPRSRAAQALAVAVVLIGALGAGGYLFQAPELYEFQGAPAIALPMTLTLMALGLGLLCARPDEGLMAVVTDPGDAGALARRILPAVLFVPMLLGWLGLAAKRAGLMDAAFSDAAVILVFVGLLTWATLRMSRSMSRAQLRVQQGQARLARTEAIAHLGSWELDVGANQLIWSDEVYRIFGLAPRAFGATYEAFLRSVHPEDRAAVDDAYGSSLADRDSYEIEHRVLRPDGSVRWVHEKCEHSRDASGRVVHSIGMVHDITETRQATAALRESEERFRALFECMAEGFALHEAIFDEAGHMVDYRCLEANPAFERLTGLTHVAGRRAREVLSPGPSWLDRLEHVVKTGAPVWLEEYSVPLGRWYQLLAYRTAPNCFATVLQDVTHRRSIERDLRAANQRLEAADQRKDEFLAMLSHELRNPLAPITTSLHLLEHAPAGSQQSRRAVQILRRQVTQMTRLVNDLLDVTRILRSKIVLEKAPVDMRDLVGATMEDYHSLFDAAGITLEATLPTEPVVLDGDRSRLVQALGNVLHNALKFTPQGGHASVSLCVEPGGARCRLVVKDSGIGLAPDTAASLFEPFVQLETTLDRAQGGLGLGLTLVKHIAELHGGRAGVDSAGLGQGAEFYLELPLGQPAGDAAGTERTGGEQQRPPRDLPDSPVL